MDSIESSPDQTISSESSLNRTKDNHFQDLLPV